MIFHLIYMSQAAEIMEPAQLKHILNSAKQTNGLLDVTGMLLYVEGKFTMPIQRQLIAVHEGRFIQLLEGKESDVRMIYKLIEEDTRHYNLIILKEGVSENRYFSDWSMGFRRLNSMKEDDHEGYVDLEEEFRDATENGASRDSFQFLRSFYDMSKSKI